MDPVKGDTKPFYKRPRVWGLAFLAVMVACLTDYLSKQRGDPDWWRLAAEAYNQAHAVPDKENAAAIYQSLRLGDLALTKDWRQTDWKLPPTTSDLCLLQEQDGTLALTLEASQRPRCFYPVEPRSAPAPQPLSHMKTVRKASRLLILRARQQAAEGRTEDAARALLAVSRIGFQHIRGFLMTQLVGVGIRGMAWQGIERLAMDTPPDPERLDEMATEIQRLSAGRPDGAETWESERLLQRGSIEYYYRPGGFAEWCMVTDPSRASSTPGDSMWVWLWMALAQPVDRRRREVEERFDLLALEHPDPAQAARIRQINNRLDILTTFFAPDKTQEVLKRDLAMERGTSILLLLRADRLRQDGYPESLETLKATTSLEIPQDPYTGKPFIYKKLEGDAFLLYSVGPNGMDDGGKLDYRDPKGWDGPSDLIFGRPPKAPATP